MRFPPPPMARQLGRLPARHDPRTLRLARYLLPSQLPPLPKYVHYDARFKGPWGMMLNDRIGDCTCASVGHAIQTWSLQTIPDSAVLTAYTAVSGYDPRTGANDNGAVELDVLTYWRNTGVGGHRIGAFAAAQPTDKREIAETIYLFGGCYIGLDMPLAWQTAKVWDGPPHSRFNFGHPHWQPGSWGGHAVYCVGYDAQYVYAVTWGAIQKITWAGMASFCEEAYAVLSPDWVDPAKPAPNGFDQAALVADLHIIAQ